MQARGRGRSCAVAVLVGVATIAPIAFAGPAAIATDGPPETADDPPIAIVVLVEGRDAYFADREGLACCVDGRCDAPVTPGVHRALASALAAPGPLAAPGVPAPLAVAGPGSRGALLIYGDGIDVRRPMADLRGLTADTLGDPRRQRGVEARPLVEGVRAAAALLRAESIERKLLFVIGDGVDPSATPEVMRGLATELAAAGIDVHPVHYAPFDRGDDSGAVHAEGHANLAALGELRLALDAASLRAALAAPLEQGHRVAVAARGAEAVRRSTLAALSWHARPRSRAWWLTIPAGLIAFAAAGLWIGRRRSTSR